MAYSLLDELVVENLLNDGLAHKNTGRVANPAVISMLAGRAFEVIQVIAYVLNWR